MNVQAAMFEAIDAASEAPAAGAPAEGTLDSVFAGMLSDEMADDGEEETAQQGGSEEPLDGAALDDSLIGLQATAPTNDALLQALHNALRGSVSGDVTEPAQTGEEPDLLPTQASQPQTGIPETVVDEAIATSQEPPGAVLEGETQARDAAGLDAARALPAQEGAELSAGELALASAPRQVEPAAESTTDRAGAAAASEARLAPSMPGTASDSGNGLGEDSAASRQNALLRETTASSQAARTQDTVRVPNEFEARLESQLQTSAASSAAQSDTPTVDPSLVTATLTPAGTTTAAGSLPPVGSPQEALPVQVEWLVARGGGRARFQLHPPNLGEVTLSVTVRGSAVDIVIQVQQQAAELVSQTREQLAQSLGSRDLHINQFEVRSAHADGGTSDGSSREEAAENPGAGASKGGSEEPRGAFATENQRASSASEESVDSSTREELRVDTAANVDLKV